MVNVLVPVFGSQLLQEPWQFTGTAQACVLQESVSPLLLGQAAPPFAAGVVIE
jgi:hypothetical protein